MSIETEIAVRKKNLLRLLHEIDKNEVAILNALHADFAKPRFEGLVTETALVRSELRYTIKNINSWTKPKMVWPSLLNFPSTDFVYKEAYGSVLIISPWNYPFLLALLPLIAAYAAGNQVVLKPSELTTNTSSIINKIISAVFTKAQVEVVEGGIAISNELLTKRWDYIFFTGSVSVGRIVARAAALHLTPVTLELGGKSPCIVDQTASLQLTAKRIVWGKFLNAGQTCVAPDYLLVHVSIKEQLIQYLIKEIGDAYGENPEMSTDFARIIDLKNWQRLNRLLTGQEIIHGGKTNETQMYLSPTLIDEPSLESELMKEEIFGPLLPIISYENEEEIKTVISRYEKPLALYVFSTSRQFIQNCVRNYSFGGGCINDVAIHLANKNLPFGGVGHSGIGAYHGKRSFDTFSHSKSIVRKANWLDIPVRYAPYKNKIQWVRKLLNWF
jgi:aldehyde dehydrogenase (NAD+)